MRIRFTENGEWIEAEGRLRKVGLSSATVREMGELNFVGVPPLGKRVARGEPILTLEASKAMFDLYSPLAGVVRGANEAALADPSLVSRDPYGQGWLVILEVDEQDESHLLEDPTPFEARPR